MKSKGSISIGGGFLESHLIIDIEPLFTRTTSQSPRLRETLATVRIDPENMWSNDAVQCGSKWIVCADRCLVETIPGTVTVAAAFLEFTCRSIQIP